jgi:hypothetical protein
MNEFLMIFRRDFGTAELQPSPLNTQKHLQEWQEWYSELAAQDKLARQLQHWDREGKVVKRNKSVTDGPYVEIKESIGGMIVVLAEDYEEAAEIAKGAPILKLGGNVEIRMAVR